MPSVSRPPLMAWVVSAWAASTIGWRGYVGITAVPSSMPRDFAPDNRERRQRVRAEDLRHPVRRESVVGRLPGRRHHLVDTAMPRYFAAEDPDAHAAQAIQASAAAGEGAILDGSRGRGSVGRASPCQGEGRGFESRRPLHTASRSRIAVGWTFRPFRWRSPWVGPPRQHRARGTLATGRRRQLRARPVLPRVPDSRTRRAASG